MPQQSGSVYQTRRKGQDMAITVSQGRAQLTGIGKPEALKHQLAGYWSRRITDEHRLVYAVEENQLVIIAARYRY
ncbi:Txe/YoeB family addiction module toxin [Cryobacterium fucosi]|uniref:Endoribonuclease YoeB n=1 Tax=Cryobacterium fucosi TaxID=1259157 RepID=A0A4R9AUN4_9MICO|nr:Txe/YoeB family addiction module toxin [Cryobacterium fucosi]